MDNPGTYVLFAGTITAAMTSEAQTEIADLEGMLSASIVARLAYGSGGTSVAATVETSLDGGTTWYQVARFDFTTSSTTKYANLSGLTAKAAAAYAALSAEGVNDGLLGPIFRANLTTVGTYAGNTVLDIRMSCR